MSDCQSPIHSSTDAPLVHTMAAYIGCPVNAGPAERATKLILVVGEVPLTRRLGSELPVLALSWAPSRWPNLPGRVFRADSSPSLPLLSIRILWIRVGDLSSAMGCSVGPGRAGHDFPDRARLGDLIFQLSGIIKLRESLEAYASMAQEALGGAVERRSHKWPALFACHLPAHHLASCCNRISPASREGTPPTLRKSPRGSSVSITRSSSSTLQTT